MIHLPLLIYTYEEVIFFQTFLKFFGISTEPLIDPNFAIAKFAQRAASLNPEGVQASRRGNPEICVTLFVLRCDRAYLVFTTSYEAA